MKHPQPVRLLSGLSVLPVLSLVALTASVWMVRAAAAGLQAPDARPNLVVILSDDHGWADLGCQGVRTDVKTPHLDGLARSGVRFTAGYVTAPQCVPSRAGLLTGRYQQRFGVDANGRGPLPLTERTLADRLSVAGYRTGMVGKWHLQPNPTDTEWLRANLPPGEPVMPRGTRVPTAAAAPYQPGRRGFLDYFHGEMQNIDASYSLEGKDLTGPERRFQIDRYRLEAQAEAAVQFLRRSEGRPFFLYVGFYGPHVPTQATEPYLARFPEVTPAKRRYGLAMLSAIDDGVGKILAELRRQGVDRRTLVVFAGDNGAPLGLTMPDVPITDQGWDGSRNDPWVGEKGMLTEGGIRVPFLLSWPDRIPGGRVLDEPVTTLDVVPTALAAANLPAASELDGVNLLPYLDGKRPRPAEGERDLFWRFWSQTAIRSGRWKYRHLAGKAEYLFDLSSPEHERVNQFAKHPEIATSLKARLKIWTETLKQPGPQERPTSPGELRWYTHFLGYQPQTGE